MANQLTKDAGLMFNVNTVRRKPCGLKHYFENNDLSVPKFKKGHIYVTAVLEKSLHHLMARALIHTKDDVTGLKTVNHVKLVEVVQQDDQLNFYYQMYMRRFNPSASYSQNLPIEEKEFDGYMEKHFEKVKLTNKGKNMLCYLVLKNYTDILHKMGVHFKYTKKKTLTGDTVKLALESSLVPDSSLLTYLMDEMARLDDVLKTLADNEKEKKKDDGTKKEKKDKKKKKSESSDDESDEDESDEEESEQESDNDESESEEEEEVKEVKPKKKNGKKTKNSSK